MFIFILRIERTTKYILNVNVFQNHKNKKFRSFKRKRAFIYILGSKMIGQTMVLTMKLWHKETDEKYCKFATFKMAVILLTEVFIHIITQIFKMCLEN